MNDGGDCRTAPATPGLLKSHGGHLKIEIIELYQFLQGLVAGDLGDGGPLDPCPPHGLDGSHPEESSQEIVENS